MPTHARHGERTSARGDAPDLAPPSRYARRAGARVLPTCGPTRPPARPPGRALAGLARPVATPLARPAAGTPAARHDRRRASRMALPRDPLPTSHARSERGPAGASRACRRGSTWRVRSPKITARADPGRTRIQRPSHPRTRSLTRGNPARNRRIPGDSSVENHRPSTAASPARAPQVGKGREVPCRSRVVHAERAKIHGVEAGGSACEGTRWERGQVRSPRTDGVLKKKKRDLSLLFQERRPPNHPTNPRRSRT